MPAKPVDALIETCRPADGPLDWGLASLVIDGHALARGQFAVPAVAGIWPDGQPFARDSSVGDALVLQLAASTELTVVQLVRDEPASSSTASSTPADAALSLCLPDHVRGRPALPIARVVHGTASFALDERFIPPLLHVASSPALCGLQDELLGLIEVRARHLTERIYGGGIGEFVDPLALITLNDARAELGHLRALPGVHPERLFVAMARLVAKLDMLFRTAQALRPLPTYRHDDPGAAFLALASSWRSALTQTLQASARRLSFESRRYGVHTIAFDSDAGTKGNRFVIEARSALPAEALRAAFPAQVKFGAIAKIRDLVNLQLPGLTLRPLPAPPRQVPPVPNAAYFELDTVGSPFWNEILAAGGGALHVAGDFPQLEIALWQIDAEG